MNRRRAGILPLALWLGIAWQAAASELPGHKPAVVKDIDRLFQLQDATAFGVLQAAEEQKTLLQEIATSLPATDAGAAPLLVHPVAAYVLSGGNPQAAEQLSQREGISPDDKHLLDAVAMFMRGDRAAAAKLFGSMDPLDLPARLTGRVALAQALLKNGVARQDSFALAIASMPGTLVEESALRRSALAYAEAGDERGFWKRLERYNRRFCFSLYAASFWNEAMAAVIGWKNKSAEPGLLQFDRVMAPLPEGRRRSLYLELARHAAAAGRPDVTEFAGRRLARLARDGSDEQQQGQLYTALFHIVSSVGDDALAQLKSVRRAALQEIDLAFLDSALALGQQIERPVEIRPEGLQTQPDEKDPLASRGAALLAETSKLLADGE